MARSGPHRTLETVERLRRQREREETPGELDGMQTNDLVSVSPKTGKIREASTNHLLVPPGPLAKA